ncbi:MAG: hypothetical protein JWQ03_2935 [Variovorax sp.]|nr:hypothetical protein [Variovorax sp.]
MPLPAPRNPLMLQRGLACIAIGAAVLLAPLFLKSPVYRDMIGGAHLVGWFAVVLGVALVAVDLVRRAQGEKRR